MMSELEAVRLSTEGHLAALQRLLPAVRGDLEALPRAAIDDVWTFFEGEKVDAAQFEQLEDSERKAERLAARCEAALLEGSLEDWRELSRLILDHLWHMGSLAAQAAAIRKEVEKDA